MTNSKPTNDGEESELLVSTRAGVRTLTLNRPRAFNSFNTTLKSALLDAVADCAADPAVRVVVLTGSGRAFCAGQDLKEHLAMVTTDDPRLADTVTGFYNPLITAITAMDKPVLAAVNGPAAGAGAALAFACDLRLAAASATFSMAFAGVALSADSGSSYTLPRLVGAGRAARMMLLGQSVDAVEALRIGMVDELADDEAFPALVAEWADRLAAGPTTAFGWIKASLRHAAAAPLASVLEFEAGAQAACFASPDHREAITAFVEKRRPHFGG